MKLIDLREDLTGFVSKKEALEHGREKYADEANKILNDLRKNYSDIIEVYKDTGFEKVLLRGMRDEQILDGVVQSTINKNRDARFMPKEAHTAISDVMEELGFPSRRNSLFCSTTEKVAQAWSSNYYMLFVENGWTGTVFENVKKDYAFDELYEVYRVFNSRNGRDFYQNRTLELKEALKSKIEELKPKTFKTKSDLLEVLNDGYYDILITGGKYIGLQVDRNQSRVSDYIVSELKHK